MPVSPLMLGFYGRRATRALVGRLRRTQAAGVLLLARNIESPRQLKSLLDGLVDGLGRPLLAAIDHEGGWVLRFRSGATAFPGNCALGRAGRPELAYAVGRQMALELGGMGINLNLAPVLDVLGENYNPGIGIRSFGSDPARVSRLGAAFIRGLQEHGVWACAKHFPGKGAAAVDAHVDLPTIRMSEARLLREHLPPFAAAARAGAACVMSSHVRFPALDSRPATFSPRILGGLLRRRLGFKGLLISDDLCMGAVTRRRPVALAAQEAFAAGHDLVIIAHDESAQSEAAELLAEEPAERLQEARARIDALLRPARRRGPASAEAGRRLAREIARRGVRVLRGAGLPWRPGARPALVLFPDFREVSERFTFEGGPLGPEKLLAARLRAWGPARLRRVPVESRDLGALAAEVDAAPRVLFFCFEARRFAGQKAVLELLRRRAQDRSAVCLIRSPHDRDWLGARMPAVDAGGYRACQLEAALEVLLS